MALDSRVAWSAIVGLAVAGTAIVMAVPAAAKQDETASLPDLVVTASAAPADVLAGESTQLEITVSNTGGTTLPALTLTEDLPAAVSYDSASVVATLTAVDGTATTYSGSGSTGTIPLAQLNPGTIVSGWDGIELAPGETLRVSVDLTVSSALAPSVKELAIAATASAGDASASSSVALTILEQALAYASEDAPA